MALMQDRNSLTRAMWSAIYTEEMLDFEGILSIIQSDTLQHFLTQSSEDPCKVSYASKQEYRFDIDRRTRTSLGRYLKRNYGSILIEKKITDRELSDFVAKVISYLPGTTTKFTILKGDAIEEVYANEIGGHSCMTGGCAEYVRIYAENPDVVNMLTLGREARALVWHTNQGKTLLDRIYPNDGQHIALFRKFAYDNNWYIRGDNGAPGVIIDFFDKDDKVISDRFTVTLNLPSNDQYPYLDSFRFVVSFGDKLVLTNTNANSNGAILDSTEGQFPNHNVCSSCDIHIRDENVIWVGGEVYCCDCASICHECGEGCCNEDLTDIGDYNYCNSCIDKYFTTCEDCGDYVHIGSVCKHNDECYCEHCFQKSFLQCYVCGEILDKEDMKEYEGYKYCEKCYDKIKSTPNEERVESGEHMPF